MGQVVGIISRTAFYGGRHAISRENSTAETRQVPTAQVLSRKRRQPPLCVSSYQAVKVQDPVNAETSLASACCPVQTQAILPLGDGIPPRTAARLMMPTHSDLTREG